MEIEDLYELVRNQAELKYDKVLSLCKSEIQKKFIGYFYYFFLKNSFDIKLLSMASKEFESDGIGLKPVYYLKNDDGVEMKVLNDAAQFEHPFTGEYQLLKGLKVNVFDVAYEVIPQHLVFNNKFSCIVELGIIMKASETGPTLGKFAIEIKDPSTNISTNSGPVRKLLLTQNKFTVIEYSPKQIDTISDNSILELENAMYKSVFGRDSYYYRFKQSI